MDRLSDLLPSVLRKRGLQPDSVTNSVFSETHLWLKNELPALSSLLNTRSFQSGVLVLESEDPFAVASCFERADDLRLHLQASMPLASITSVRVLQSHIIDGKASILP